MKKLCWLCMLIMIPLFRGNAQLDDYFFNIRMLGGYSYSDSSESVPFWMRANQYGSVPLDKASLSLIAIARKDYDTDRKRLFDWGASLEGRMNVGNKVNFALVEGYAKVRVSVFELRGGRSKEIMGLCDTGLTTGAWSISGNALGIPKIELSIPEFYSIPWFGKMFAIRGQFAHGWLGNTTMYRRTTFIEYDVDTIRNKTYFHQKSLYGRFGKPSWRLKLYGGFSHQVFWGNERNYYGDVFTLTPLQTYVYVVTGKGYHNEEIPTHSRVGNQLGSIDLGVEYRLKKVKLFLYRQNIYDVGNLYYFANIEDGLNGLVIENLNNSQSLFRWKKVLLEFLYTKNQAGAPDAPETPTPYENYYNNHQYIKGWSYYDVPLGTPFITTHSMVRQDLAHSHRDYFTNNRVMVFHLGAEGSIQKWDCMLKASLSRNYGTYRTTNEEQSTGFVNPGDIYGIFGRRDQFSGYIECHRPLNKGYRIGCLAAFDIGELYYNSFGFMVSASKTF